MPGLHYIFTQNYRNHHYSSLFSSKQLVLLRTADFQLFPKTGCAWFRTNTVVLRDDSISPENGTNVTTTDWLFHLSKLFRWASVVNFFLKFFVVSSYKRPNIHVNSTRKSLWVLLWKVVLRLWGTPPVFLSRLNGLWHHRYKKNPQYTYHFRVVCSGAGF